MKDSTIEDVNKVTAPFEATLTNPSVYELWAEKVIACASGSLAVRVCMVDPEVRNSAIFTFALEVNDGAVLV